MQIKEQIIAGSTIDNEEIERFSRIADQWWDEKGKFAPLHSMNPVRIEFIRDTIINHTPHSTLQTPLAGVNLLDIGCGGGLIAEPMARLGANVTAIDASEKNIAVAKLHAQKMGLEINYECTSAEQLAENKNAAFDVVLALEIIEHIADINLFIKSISTLLKPNGIVILSTLNRTPKSYALAILGAEYIFRILPIGTHSWKKFLRPSEVCNILEEHSLSVSEITGMVMNPLTWKWRLDKKDLSVNYMMIATK